MRISQRHFQPFFLLLTFGYKMIHQTKMIPVHEMQFERQNVDAAAQEDPPYLDALQRLFGWLLVK